MMSAITKYIANDQKTWEIRPKAYDSMAGMLEKREANNRHNSPIIGIRSNTTTSFLQNGGRGATWDRSSEPQIPQKVASRGFTCPLGHILPRLYGVMPQ